MAVRDLLEIFFAYLQYLMLMMIIPPSPFPSFYRAPIDAMSVFLDLRIFFDRDEGVLKDWLPPGLPVDIRLQFIFVSVTLPLILSFTAILSLAPKLFILWYSFALSSMILMVIGIIALAADDPIVNTAIGKSNLVIFLAVGVSLFVLCLVAAALFRIFKHYYPDEKKKKIEEIMQEHVDSINISGQLFRFTYFVVTVFLGLLFMGAFSIPGFTIFDDLGLFGVVIGSLLLLLAAVVLVWSIVAFFARGRRAQWIISLFVQNNYLSILLLLISVLYVPAVTNVMMMINCQDHNCARNSRIILSTETAVLGVNTTLNDEGICQRCMFSEFPQACPVTLQNDLCGRATISSRLVQDIYVECDPALKRYFWPACGIMFVSFVISMPIVNYFLTRRSTAMLEEDFRLDARQSAGCTDEEIFEEKVLLSDNIAKFIYDPFQMKFKHWRMLFLFQKLGCVVVSVFRFQTLDIRSEQVAFVCTSLVHIICLIYLLITRPFKRWVENLFTLATQTVVTLMALCGTVVVNGLSFPDIVWLVIAILVLAVPVISMIVGIILTVRQNSINQEERRKRIENALRDAENQEPEEAELLAANEDNPFAGTIQQSSVNLKELVAEERRNKNRVQRVDMSAPRAAPPPKHGLGVAPNRAAQEKKKNTKPKSVAETRADHSKSGIGFLLEDVPLTTDETMESNVFLPGEESVRISTQKRSPSMREDPTFTQEKALVSAANQRDGNRNNRRKKPRKNTAEESLRAIARWRKARMWVLQRVREQNLEEEEEPSPKKGDKKGKKKKKKDKGKKNRKGWDNLLVLLLKKTREEREKNGGGDDGELPDLESNLRDIQRDLDGDDEDAARSRFKAIYAKHLETVTSMQKAVDFNINEDTMNVLHIFFMVCGMLALTALGFGVLGIIQHNRDIVFYPHENSNGTTTTTLAGYATWNEFSSSCCCTAFNQQDSLNVDVEKWVCANGKTKERIRRTANIPPLEGQRSGNTVLFESGLNVRPLCGLAFINPSCAASVDPRGAVGLSIAGCGTNVTSRSQFLW